MENCGVEDSAAKRGADHALDVFYVNRIEPGNPDPISLCQQGLEDKDSSPEEWDILFSPGEGMCVSKRVTRRF